ncbi:hypothetical protein [Streptomyces sp. NPDC003435]
MSDDVPDDGDVVALLTERIEARFGMGLDELKAALAANPAAHPEATEVVKRHGLLVDSQAALERAEDDLVAVLDTHVVEVDDRTMYFADRVNEAVTTRDGRALVVRWLLDSDAPGKQGLAAERLARINRGSRTGPAMQTSAPSRPAFTTTPGRAARAGRGAR